MRKKNPLLLCLGLAFLLAGGIACNSAPEQEETAVTSDTDQTATAPPAAATTTGTPAAVGQAPDGLTTGDTTAPATPADNAPLAVSDLPDVVAKVNGQPIKKQELIQAAQVVQIRLSQMGRPATPSKAFYRQVLDELIKITLLQQDAKAQGVVASGQEVQRQIDARKSVFPSEDAFKKALEQAGITEEILRQQARDQLSVQKYVETKLVPNAAISEQATRDFYEKNKAKIRSPERLHLRHILIGVDAKTSPADKQKARQKAGDILKRLQEGEDFSQLAMANSDDTGSKLKGGDLGWIVKGQTVPQFEKAAFALTKPNDLSPVVESPFGFHIIQLLERQQAGAVPYEQVKDRIAGMLKERQTQQQVQARVGELRAKGKVEVFI
jgi:peptidyl-prolyl cis-trans isomerase C